MLGTLEVKQKFEFRLVSLLLHDGLLKGRPVLQDVDGHAVDDEAHAGICGNLDLDVWTCSCQDELSL